MSTEILTQQELKELLHYDPETGVFTWIKPLNMCFLGVVAGTVGINGYRAIQIKGKKYRAHRLAFIYMEGCIPKRKIDHINHKRDDNKWRNLEHATNASNAKNQKLHSNNKSGICGVFWNNYYSKWEVSISYQNKQRFIGRFSSLERAISARKKAELEYGYHPNHGKVDIT